VFFFFVTLITYFVIIQSFFKIIRKRLMAVCLLSVGMIEICGGIPT